MVIYRPMTDPKTLWSKSIGQINGLLRVATLAEKLNQILQLVFNRRVEALKSW